MRRIAIIPARSGSKGLPDKNLKEVAGQSLLARAVHCAVQADLFARVYVSTDSAGYAEAAVAVASVSNRSAIETTTSGLRSSKTVANSDSPSPVDLADVTRFSPSSTM